MEICDLMKWKLIIAIICPILIMLISSGCLNSIFDDDIEYKYEITITVENEKPFFVLLPIIEQYHDEDKSTVLSNLIFSHGSGNFDIERINGRYINISSNENVSLICSGNSPGFSYTPTHLQFEHPFAPSERNESLPCYISIEENTITISQHWYSKEPNSIVDIMYTGTYNQSGWFLLNATYGENWVS